MQNVVRTLDCGCVYLTDGTRERCFCGHPRGDHILQALPGTRLGNRPLDTIGFCWVNMKWRIGDGHCPCNNYEPVADRIRRARRESKPSLVATFAELAKVAGPYFRDWEDPTL